MDTGISQYKYDFKPFQKVLVRVGDTWYGDFFSHTDEEGCNLVGGGVPTSENLLPYEGNEHLLGTTDSPKPKWEPRPGELVAVASDKRFWYPKFFFRKEEDGQFAVKSCPEHTNYDRYLYCEPLRKHFNVPEE